MSEASEQVKRDMRKLRVKHGDAAVDKAMVTGDFDNFLKQPIMATVRAVKRKMQAPSKRKAARQRGKGRSGR